MNHTRRTLALVASVLAGSGLVLIGQQSAQAEVATPCVTTTIAPAAELATATAAPSAAADAESLEVAVDAVTSDSSPAAAPEACAPSPAATAEATAEDAPDNPLCNLPGHRLCVELPTTIPDLPTDTDTSSPTTTQPTDDPSTTTTTTTSAPTSTGPVVPDPGNGGGGNNGGGNSGGGNNGGGNGNNGGGSAPTGTLGTGPIAVEGNVGSRDNCGALECANQDYADVVATRTQQNAAVPSAAAVAGPALARTGSDISTMATYAGGLLIAGALLLGARRRLVPGYVRRH